MRVFVLFYTSIQAWKTQRQRGDTPDDLPYGLQNLEHFGIKLSYSDVAQQKAVKMPLRPIEKWLFGFDVVQPLLLIRRMRKSQVILSTLDRQGILLGWLRAKKLFGLHRVPHVFISTSLAEEVRHFSPRRLVFVRKALSSVDRLVYYSQNQTDIFADVLKVQRERLRCVPFGVSAEVFRPDTEPARNFILSVGWDKGRDYATLLEAVSDVAVPFVVVCARSNVANVQIPPNVTIMYHVPISQLRGLYQQCKLVVVPTHNFAYPTGQTVVLEAMACGKPVIVTANQGMGDYIEHGVNGLLVPPGDAPALTRAIESAIADDGLLSRIGERARRDIECKFNTVELSRLLAEIMGEVAVGN